MTFLVWTSPTWGYEITLENGEKIEGENGFPPKGKVEVVDYLLSLRKKSSFCGVSGVPYPVGSIENESAFEWTGKLSNDGLKRVKEILS